MNNLSSIFNIYNVKVTAYAYQ